MNKSSRSSIIVGGDVSVLRTNLSINAEHAVKLLVFLPFPGQAAAMISLRLVVRF